MSEQQLDETTTKTQAEPVEEDFELTPEVMEYENRRTDLIISVAVVALMFFLAAIRDRSAETWLRFRSGQLIAESFPAVPKTDSLTYTAQGAPWTNANWLYDVGTYLIARPGFDDNGIARANGQLLVGVKVGFCVLVMLLLLGIRHPGPTRWWTAVCAALAAVGMCGRVLLGPEIVTNVLLAAVASLWFQARYRNRFWMLFLTIPATVLWANFDLTWPLAGALILLAGIGELVAGFLPLAGRFHQTRLSPSHQMQVFAVAGLCFAAGFATPYGLDGFLFPWRWFNEILPSAPGLEKEVLGWSRMDFILRASNLLTGQLPYNFHAWYGLIALSLAGFLVNFKSFNVGRLLWTLLGVALPLIAIRLMPPSAILLAISSALNFQEFYLEEFGAEARISRGWVLWSQVGRALTVVVVFFAIFCAFTGRVQKLAGVFGFGIRTENYMADAAKKLTEIKPQGKCISFTMPLANFRSWAQPGAQDFADTRFQAGAAVLTEYSAVRNALLNDFYPRPLQPAKPAAPQSGKTTPTAQPGDAANPAAPGANQPPNMRVPTPEELAAQQKAWKDVFAKYKITHLVIDPRIDSGGSNVQTVLSNLMNSPLFAPVFVSDQAVIFGRVDDAPDNVDRKLFQDLAIKANRMVFRSSRDLPKPTERFVQAPGLIDWIWRTRVAIPPGVQAGALFQRMSRNIEQPGGLYLSLNYIRDALAENPDSGESYAALELAYQAIFGFESYNALVAVRNEQLKAKQAADAKAAAAKPAVAPPAQTAAADPKATKNPSAAAAPPSTTASLPPLRVPPTNEFISMRHYQIMAAARSAAIAQPSNPFMQLELFKLCKNNEFLDSALGHLQAARRLLPNDAVQDQLQKEEIDLEAKVKARRDVYDKYVAESRQAYEKAGIDPDRPFERASIAISQRLPDLAMEQIESASAFSPDLAEAGPFVIGLYLTLGYPDKALTPLQQMRPQQQRFAAGEWSWLMGQIQLLQGQFEDAITSTETALAELRARRAMTMLDGFHQRIRDGEVIGLFSNAINFGNDREREARYLFMRGLARIEMGKPAEALKDFEKCLNLAPRFVFRAVIEAYWPFMSDAKLPAPPPPYDFDKEEIKVRFAAAPSPASKPADSKKPATGSAAPAKPANAVSEPLNVKPPAATKKAG